MSLHRKDPRRDTNERIIVQALEARGFHVDRVSAKGFPDLVVSKRFSGGGDVWFVEIKRPKGKLTPAQVQWRENWQGPTPRTLRTVEEAMRFPDA